MKPIKPEHQFKVKDGATVRINMPENKTWHRRIGIVRTLRQNLDCVKVEIQDFQINVPIRNLSHVN